MARPPIDLDESPAEFEFRETLAAAQYGPEPGDLDTGAVTLKAAPAAWWAGTSAGNLRVAVNRGNLAKRDARGYRLADVDSFRDGDRRALESRWDDLAYEAQAWRVRVQAEYAAHGDHDAYMAAMVRGSNTLSKDALGAAADLAPRVARRVAADCGKYRDKPFDTVVTLDAAELAPDTGPAQVGPRFLQEVTVTELNQRSRRSREFHRDDDVEHELSWTPRSVWD